MPRGWYPGRAIPETGNCAYYTGNVTRATRLRLLARDRAGAALEFEMEGFEARVVRYELDHLDGMLFVDRLVSRRTDLFRR